MFLEVNQKISETFKDIQDDEKKIREAFHQFSFDFIGRKIPEVVTFNSLFNYAVITPDTVLGIGLDMYLGSNSPYYPALGFPEYKIRKMRREYVPVDALRGWIESEYPIDEGKQDFLSQMIYKGKIIYALDGLMPKLNDTLKIGYSGSQLEWCYENEKNIWSFFVEQKLLFSNSIEQYSKYISEGPTTNGFRQDGRAGDPLPPPRPGALGHQPAGEHGHEPPLLRDGLRRHRGRDARAAGGGVLPRRPALPRFLVRRGLRPPAGAGDRPPRAAAGGLAQRERPPLPAGEIGGAVLTRQGRVRVAEVFDRRTDPRERHYYWMVAERLEGEAAAGAEVDDAAVGAGFISVTPINFELTDEGMFVALGRWDLEPGTIPGERGR